MTSSFAIPRPCRRSVPSAQRRGRRSALAVVLLCVTALTAPATAAGVSVHCSVDKSEVTVGDRLTFTVVIESDPKVKVIPPDIGVNLWNFEVKDYNLTHPREPGKKVLRVDYVLATFETGDQVIPPLTVTYLENGKRKQVHTEKITIHVKSLAPSKAREPKDIKPPVEVPPNWSGFRLVAAIAAGALALLLSLAVWIRKRRRAGRGEAVEEPPRPAHETAFAELTALRESSLLEEGRYKEYYSGVADALRRYLEGRYGVRALDETTGEIIRQLQTGLLHLDRVDELRALLEKCDLVKFAKFLPPDPDVDAPETLACVWEFVEATRPVEEEPEEDQEEDEPEEAGEPEAREEEAESESGENFSPALESPAETANRPADEEAAE